MNPQEYYQHKYSKVPSLSKIDRRRGHEDNLCDAKGADAGIISVAKMGPPSDFSYEEIKFGSTTRGFRDPLLSSPQSTAPYTILLRSNEPVVARAG